MATVKLTIGLHAEERMRFQGEVGLGDHVAYVDCCGIGVDTLCFGTARAVVVKVATEPALALEGIRITRSFPDLS